MTDPDFGTHRSWLHLNIPWSALQQQPPKPQLSSNLSIVRFPHPLAMTARLTFRHRVIFITPALSSELSSGLHTRHAISFWFMLISPLPIPPLCAIHTGFITVELACIPNISSTPPVTYDIVFLSWARLQSPMFSRAFPIITIASITAFDYPPPSSEG